MDVDSAIARAAESLGYSLKQEQKKSIESFVLEDMMYLSLPTGYEKSLCYILLPRVFDLVRGVERKSTILVVSPLIALMKDQVAAITGLGLSAALVSDRESTSATVRAGIKGGDYQVVFVSPESLFRSTEWRSMLSSSVYRENLVGFVVDEAHCIKKW